MLKPIGSKRIEVAGEGRYRRWVRGEGRATMRLSNSAREGI